MINNIVNGLIAKFIENPEAWIGFWAMCGLNLLFMVIYVLTHNKKWIIFSFAGICVAIYVMLYLVIMQGMK